MYVIELFNVLIAIGYRSMMFHLIVVPSNMGFRGVVTVIESRVTESSVSAGKCLSVKLALNFNYLIFKMIVNCKFLSSNELISSRT